MKDKIIFIGSVIILIYFIGLIATSYFKYDATAVGVARELLTIPALLLMFVLLFMASVSFYKSNFKLRSFSFYSIILLLISIALLTTANFYLAD